MKEFDSGYLLKQPKLILQAKLGPIKPLYFLSKITSIRSKYRGDIFYLLLFHNQHIVVPALICAPHKVAKDTANTYDRVLDNEFRNGGSLPGIFHNIIVSSDISKTLGDNHIKNFVIRLKLEGKKE